MTTFVLSMGAESVQKVQDKLASGIEVGTDPARKQAPLYRGADLLRAVEARVSGLSRLQIRSVQAAVLTELSGAISRGENLYLPQLGRVKLVRSTLEDGGRTMTVKIKRLSGEKGDVPPLAPAEE